jgi:uncharacterized membrane protein
LRRRRHLRILNPRKVDYYRPILWITPIWLAWISALAITVIAAAALVWVFRPLPAAHEMRLEISTLPTDVIVQQNRSALRRELCPALVVLGVSLRLERCQHTLRRER